MVVSVLKIILFHSTNVYFFEKLYTMWDGMDLQAWIRYTITLRNLEANEEDSSKKEDKTPKQYKYRADYIIGMIYDGSVKSLNWGTLDMEI